MSLGPSRSPQLGETSKQTSFFGQELAHLHRTIRNPLFSLHVWLLYCYGLGGVIELAQMVGNCNTTHARWN
jgi:hypothetical protein